MKRCGIIACTENKRGVPLPDLAEIDTPKAQLSITLEKGGIPFDTPYRMERFEAVKHS